MTTITAIFSPFTQDEVRELKAGLKKIGLDVFFGREVVMEIEPPSDRLARLIELTGHRNWTVIGAGVAGIVFYVTAPKGTEPVWDGYFLVPFACINSIGTMNDEQLDRLQKSEI